MSWVRHGPHPLSQNWVPASPSSVMHAREAPYSEQLSGSGGGSPSSAGGSPSSAGVWPSAEPPGSVSPSVSAGGSPSVSVAPPSDVSGPATSGPLGSPLERSQAASSMLARPRPVAIEFQVAVVMLEVL